MKLRTYVPTLPPRAPYISEAEVFARVTTAIKTLRSLPLGVFLGTRSNWPRELDFHAEAIRLAMTPGAKVENKKIKQAIKKLRARDFDDINLDGEPISNMAEPSSRKRPTEKQISDCPVALGWYAKLSQLPENIGQFEGRCDELRTAKRRTAEVDDQIIVTLYALGFSPRIIAMRLKKTDREVERDLNAVARKLFLIANGLARYADLHRIQNLSRERVSV